MVDASWRVETSIPSAAKLDDASKACSFGEILHPRCVVSTLMRKLLNLVKRIVFQVLQTARNNPGTNLTLVSFSTHCHRNVHFQMNDSTVKGDTEMRITHLLKKNSPPAQKQELHAKQRKLVQQLNDDEVMISQLQLHGEYEELWQEIFHENLTIGVSENVAEYRVNKS